MIPKVEVLSQIFRGGCQGKDYYWTSMREHDTKVLSYGHRRGRKSEYRGSTVSTSLNLRKKRERKGRLNDRNFLTDSRRREEKVRPKS